MKSQFFLLVLAFAAAVTASNEPNDNTNDTTGDEPDDTTNTNTNDTTTGLYEFDPPCGNSTSAKEWSCGSGLIGCGSDSIGCCLQSVDSRLKKHFFKVECLGPCTDIEVRATAASGDIDLHADTGSEGCCGLCDEIQYPEKQLTERCPVIDLSSLPLDVFYIRPITYGSVKDIKLIVSSRKGNLMGVTLSTPVNYRIHDPPCGNSTNGEKWSCGSDSIGTGCCLQSVDSRIKKHFFKVECLGPCTEISVRATAASGDIDLWADTGRPGSGSLCKEESYEYETLTEKCPIIDLSSEQLDVFYITAPTYGSVKDSKLTVTSRKHILKAVAPFYF